MGPSRSNTTSSRDHTDNVDVGVGEQPSNHPDRRDLDALNALDTLDQRSPPTTTIPSSSHITIPRQAHPRRSYTDPGDGPAPRPSHDSVKFSNRGRFSQYELRPIPSRGLLDDEVPDVVIDDSATAANKDATEDLTVAAEKKYGFSIPSNIKASIQKAKADRKRTKLRKITWQARARDGVAAAYQKIVMQGILRRQPLRPTKDGRHVPLNPHSVGVDGLIDERTQKPYIDNFIRSSRYTVYDFVPKQLLFQFSKLGNFYFLVMGTLQMIPGLSTVGRWTTIVPLSIFIAFSMAKEGYDDYRRYQLDKSENRSMTWIMARSSRRAKDERGEEGPLKQWRRKLNISESAEKDVDIEEIALQELDTRSVTKGEDIEDIEDWMSVQWQHVRVGDIVRIHRDEAVPADMVLLHATGPNGIAYIETMALDGETNLKSKQTCPLLTGRCATMEGLTSMEATVVSEDPNIDLYGYDGRVTVEGETLPLSLNNILYRGSTLRNTTMAFGLVVNSGEECKIRMNANKNVTAKKPAMQSIINKIVLFQIFIVLMLGAGLTIGYYLWEKDVGRTSPYLVRDGVYNASVKFKDIFFGYLIMFNTLIPLSLYISMEITKIGQLILLHDVDMHDAVTNTPMVANTTTILENLGQVTHVFSDKTGTLTENVMRFRKLTVAGVACLHDIDVQRDEDAKQRKAEASQKSKGKQRALPPAMAKSLRGDFEVASKDDRPAAPNRLSSTGSFSHWKSSVRPDDEPEMKSEELLDYIRRKPNTTFSRKAKHFLLCIALCHTCLPEIKDNGDIEFQAASPDELALVEAARDLGFLVIDRPTRAIHLQTQAVDGTPQVETYRILDVIEFSSKRKRMSIILRMPDGRICIFCKGADNVIMSRLKLSHLAEQKAKDIERRASMRKTFEQDKAFRRMSVQVSAKTTPRNSFNLKRGESSDRLEGLRRSISGRRSTDLNRLSQSEGVSSWLNRRQTEELASPRGSADLLRSPRQSLGRVPSFENFDHQIDESVAANEAAVFEKCFQHIDDFASEGLRTLLYAYRYIDEDTYSKWKSLYKDAETSLDDRQTRIEEAADVIEQKFDLAGATAIEDKLQDGVPETIDKLRRANVKVWMLTGDKRETAINIGHSARVCKPFSETYILDAAAGNLSDTMTTTLNDVGRGMVPHSVLVVDGQTLAVIDASEDLSILFYDLVLRVDSVICCRASPSQKANLVKAIRRYVPKSMTLAIGDGANDIGMIQASHVGIGISGREGLQAARISDYSIAQFRFLQNLLFVHGRWNYLRTGKYVLGTFWKEILFFLAQAHYQRMTGYTGTSLYESWSLTVFNSLFTSLPVILLGIFERDLRAETLLAVPELYTFGQQNRGFSVRQYIGWMFMGVSGSFVIFYFMWGVYQMALFTEDTSLYAMGSICFTVGVIFINIKLLVLELHSKTVITFGGITVSIVGWFMWMLLLSGVYPLKIGPYQVRDAFLHNFGRKLIWWTTVLLGLATLVVMELLVQSIRRVYWPTDQDLMQRIEKDSDVKKVLQEFATMAEKGEMASAEAEVQEHIAERGRESIAVARASHDKSRSPHTPHVSVHETRKTMRVSHDDYHPPDFTPPAEERENPFEVLKMKIMNRGE